MLSLILWDYYYLRSQHQRKLISVILLLSAMFGRLATAVSSASITVLYMIILHWFICVFRFHELTCWRQTSDGSIWRMGGFKSPISHWISIMKNHRYLHRYLHRLHADYCPHLWSYYHNVSSVVIFGLHQVLPNPGNFIENSNWTLLLSTCVIYSLYAEYV